MYCVDANVFLTAWYITYPPRIFEPESRGAGQVDITLIAYAKIHEGTVVTLESFQHQRPAKKMNFKIPLICTDEGVPWLNFVEMLDSLGVNM